MIRTFLITAAAVIGCALPALAGPAVSRWAVETSKPSAHLADAFQGETLWLEPSLLSYGAAVSVTNSALTLHWQTNGMGSAWWSKPAEAVPAAAGRIRAVFSPTNDVGAAQYTFYIQATDDGASNYRAYGLIRMRSAPGFSPTATPAPSYQWASPADLQAVSNALASAVQSEAGTRAAADSALSDALAAAEARLTLADARRIVQADTNAWIDLAGGTGTLWRIEQESVQEPDTNQLIFASAPAIDDTPGAPYGGYIGQSAVVAELGAGEPWSVYAQGSVFERQQNGTWLSTNPVVSSSATTLTFAFIDGWMLSDWGPTMKQAYLGSWPAGDGPGDYDMVNEFEDGNPPEAGFIFQAALAWGSNTVYRTVTNAYPLATQAGTVILLSDHDASADAHPTLARSSAVPTFGQATNIASFVAAATIPANAVAGWLLYDPGSNMWVRVSVSNLSFTVWEVTP